MPMLPAPSEIRKTFSLPGLFEVGSHRFGPGRIDLFGLMTVAGGPIQICVSVQFADSGRGAPVLAGDLALDWWPVRRRDQSDGMVRQTAIETLRLLGERLPHVDWLPEMLSRRPRPVRNWTFEMTASDRFVPSDLLDAAFGSDDIDIYVQLRSNCTQKCRFCPSSSPLFSPADQDGDLELVTTLAERVASPARARGLLTTMSIDADDVAAHRHLPAIMDLIHESCGCPVHLVVPAVRLSSLAVVAAIARLPGLFKLSTSLFGASSAVHDDVSGRPGAFVETVRALKNLSDFPFWVQGHFVLTQGAVPEIGAVVDTLAHFGIDVMIQGLLADCFAHEPLLRGIMPDIALLRSALEESSTRILDAARSVNVEITDFPVCAIPPGLRQFATVHHPRSRLYRHGLAETCATCVHAEGCIGVSAVYFETHGISGMSPEPG